MDCVEYIYIFFLAYTIHFKWGEIADSHAACLPWVRAQSISFLADGRQMTESRCGLRNGVWPLALLFFIGACVPVEKGHRPFFFGCTSALTSSSGGGSSSSSSRRPRFSCALDAHDSTQLHGTSADSSNRTHAPTLPSGQLFAWWHPAWPSTYKSSADAPTHTQTRRAAAAAVASEDSRCEGHHFICSASDDARRSRRRLERRR